MTTGNLLSFCSRELESQSEARELVCSVLDMSDVSLVMKRDMDVPAEKYEKIMNSVAQRKSGRPLAYILGKRDFYGRTFKVTDDTLIPQPDTETLVENALEHALKRDFHGNLKVLDMCTGTGCIGISFVCGLGSSGFDDVDLVLADISEKALDVAAVNCCYLDPKTSFKVIRSDIFSEISGKFDIILTNPPYIASSVIPTLDVQVQSEPLLALDGGEDGLSLIRRIVTEAPGHLNEGGAMFMEIGYDQGSAVSDLFIKHGFSNVRVIKDLGGNHRVVSGIMNR